MASKLMRCMILLAGCAALASCAQRDPVQADRAESKTGDLGTPVGDDPKSGDPGRP